MSVHELLASFDKSIHKGMWNFAGGRNLRAKCTGKEKRMLFQADDFCFFELIVSLYIYVLTYEIMQQLRIKAEAGRSKLQVTVVFVKFDQCLGMREDIELFELFSLHEIV